MRLLITGGCGFVGSNLALHSINKGDELILFDNLYRLGAVQNLHWLEGHGKFKFEYGDIRNSNDVNRVIQAYKPEAIFHLAGQVAMTTSIADPRRDFEVNVTGTINLLEAVRQCIPEAIVLYSSTNKVYGYLEQYHYKETKTRYVCVEKPDGFEETVPLNFHSPYGCSKGAADQYMLDYARVFGLNTIVFRHSSMYGGRQFATCDQGWIGWFCQKALETRDGLLKETFTISGSGKQVRDILHVDDIVKLYFSSVEKCLSIKGDVFNIGGGLKNSVSILELFSLLEELTGIGLNFKHLPVREGDQKVFIADISKIKNILGWEPAISYKKGISQMMEWLSEKRNI